jgi:hypothetical protein
MDLIFVSEPDTLLVEPGILDSYGKTIRQRNTSSARWARATLAGDADVLARRRHSPVASASTPPKFVP